MIRTDLKVDNTEKIHFPPADKNKGPILEVLQSQINVNARGTVLEVSSGTGQHVVFFAEHFPQLTFQPSDYDEEMLPSIKAYSAELQTGNVLDPLVLDASQLWTNIPDGKFDFLININMIHVSPFACTIGLFKNAGRVLKNGGLMFTYGAYAQGGKIEPESNVEFDKLIRSKNEEWGLRDIDDLEKLARTDGIRLIKTFELPSNNKCLIWRKESEL